MPITTVRMFLGIDPGMNGGMAVIYPRTGMVVLQPLSKLSPADMWEWISGYELKKNASGEATNIPFAAIELQTPRGTRFFDKSLGQFRSSILKSTCYLYGGYMRMVGWMLAASIPHVEVPPTKWQKEFGLKKEKGEKASKWKGRLREKAQSLFPHCKITLATADALLMAEYARRIKTRGG